MTPFWISTNGAELSQGDYLPGCRAPLIPIELRSDTEAADIRFGGFDLIVVTQSCDLVNAKAGTVALCQISTIPQYELANPAFTKKGMWEEVRKGRREGLYLLASPTTPEVSREALVVNFRELVSLPVGYLRNHATALGERWRLQPPFLEHFSQAFARFFMRVGLPSAIPPFVD